MQGIATPNVLRVFNPLRLAGPIFDKELRVASRRRRTYLLRFVYVGALTLFVVQVLTVATRVSGANSNVVQMSQMGQVGTAVVSSIVWFQFLLAQLLAIVLLSGAVGNEIRQGSLDALLVTPVSSLQIVVGKLLSGLLQLVLLLAVSLPLLAVVRVFGGVPWGYVVLSLGTTLVAALFAGSLSLLLSVTNRHAYRVVSNAVGWCLVLWAGIPAVLGLLRWVGGTSHPMIERVLYVSNPFFVMLSQTQSMLSASSGRWPVRNLWPAHCLVLLGGAAIMLLLAVWRLRRAALAPTPGPKAEETGRSGDRSSTGGWWVFGRRRSAVRRVRGAPVVWKELRRPIFPRGRRGVFNILGLIAAACVILGVLVYLLVHSRVTLGPVSIVVAVLLVLLFIINVAGSAASTIAREKEARTLPILLMTPLDNGTIVRGKAWGLLRRNLPLLIPVPFLGALGYAFTPNPHASGSAVAAFVVTFVVSALADMAFLLGLGLCLSVYLRTAMPAVVSTFVGYIAFRFFVAAAGSILFLIAVRVGLVSPDRAYAQHAMTALHVIIFAGLGLLLAFIGAAGLRRNAL